MNNLFNNMMNAAKNSAVNYINNNGNYEKADKLKSQLHHCTYYD